MPQAEVNKKIWGYIKRHGLQDEDNKQMINTDEHLKAIFDRIDSWLR
jgi:chromatin remodeling complex protein RSC6